MILLVGLQVLGEVADALGEDCDLNLCGTGVVIGLAVFLDEFGGLLLRNAELCCHFSTFQVSKLSIAPGGQAGGACELGANQLPF